MKHKQARVREAEQVSSIRKVFGLLSTNEINDPMVRPTVIHKLELFLRGACY